MNAGKKIASNVASAYYGRAIYDAVSKGKEDVIRHLLSIGTSVTTNNGYYDGILARAVSNGDFAIVKLLVEAKADLESTHCGHYNPTALQISVEKKRLDIAEYLIAAGANVNAGKGGRTKSALHTACLLGEITFVKVLLEAGADVDVVSYEGQTVLQAAEQGGNEDVLALLKMKQEQQAIAVAKSIESTWEVVEKPLVAEGASLCTICEEKLFHFFLPSEISFGRGETWHPSLTSLKASVEAGCVFCTFFRKQLGSKELKIPQSSPVPLVMAYNSSFGEMDIELPDLCMQSQITEPFPTDVERPREAIARFYYTIEPFEGKRKSLTGSTSSTETFNQIHSWINNCTDQHKGCKNLQLDFLPPRLLDLEPSSHKDHVELVSTAALSSGGIKYMTLSHCHHDILKAMIPRESMLALYDLDSAPIAIPDLPPLFIDAIRVAKNLNVRYLWIDILCATQDPQKSRTEVPNLIDQIFGNSCCTIAAASSQYLDAECGLFYTIPTDGLSAEFVVTSKGGERKKIQVIKTQPGWMWKYKDSSLGKDILGLLERELSPRFSGLEDGNVYDLWHKAVAEFTVRSTRNDKALLPALSCLAKVMRSKFEGRYIAGLWEKDFMRSLAWCHASNNKNLAKRYPRYIAPSWSWASVNGPTDFSIIRSHGSSSLRPYDFEPEPGSIKITKCNITLSDPTNEFTLPTAAELHVHTPLIHGIFGYDASWNNHGQIIHLTDAAGVKSYGELFLDVPDERDKMGLKVVSVVYLFGKKCASYRQGHTEGPYGKEGCCGVGLAIVPVREEERENGRSVYRRVGVVEGVPVSNFV
ncbi:hypothetical protein BGZ60DRAFT_498388, partial [Tricladium varicosporioides]